jgi:hypothetical protein
MRIEHLNSIERLPTLYNLRWRIVLWREQKRCHFSSKNIPPKVEPMRYRVEPRQSGICKGIRWNIFLAAYPIPRWIRSWSSINAILALHKALRSIENIAISRYNRRWGKGSAAIRVFWGCPSKEILFSDKTSKNTYIFFRLEYIFWELNLIRTSLMDLFE